MAEKLNKAALDIVNEWLAFSGYDPDQHEFNLLSSSYEYHMAGRTINQMMSGYDVDGSFSAIYVKNVFLKAMKDSRVSLLNVLVAQEDFARYTRMYETFKSDDMQRIESTLLDSLHKMTETLCGKPMIGERDLDAERQVLNDSVVAVISRLAMLKIDSYKRSGRLSDNLIGKVSSKIAVFPTLAQCVTSIEQAPDAMYLCYIRNGDSADGYFGFFLKNNGNILSFNERPDEAFSGQHKTARNARWTDEKKYDIFPYGLFKFDEPDYKGYYTTHKIDDSKLSFADMSSENLFPSILAMVLLANRYANQENPGKDVYIDSLLPANLKRLQTEAEKTNALVPVNPASSAIVAANNSFEVGFTQDDVLSGSKNAYFNTRDPENHGISYDETGSFPEQTAGGFTEMLIQFYGGGFQLDLDAVMRTNSSLRMLPAAEGENDSGYAVEFVGSARRMQMEMYRKARQQLADYIKAQILKEYEAFGNGKAIGNWWKTAIKARQEYLEELCVKLYLASNIEAHPKKDEVNNFIQLENEHGIMAYYSVGKRGEIPYDGTRHRIYDYTMFFNVPEEKPWYNRMYKTGAFFCPVTGNKVTIFFFFTPKNWKELEMLSGRKVPKIVHGWEERAYREAGNHCLEATDAVARVRLPIECDSIRDFAFEYGLDENACYNSDWKNAVSPDFNVSLAWSKRGWAKVLKKYQDKLEEKDA